MKKKSSLVSTRMTKNDGISKINFLLNEQLSSLIFSVFSVPLFFSWFFLLHTHSLFFCFNYELLTDMNLMVKFYKQSINKTVIKLRLNIYEINKIKKNNTRMKNCSAFKRNVDK